MRVLAIETTCDETAAAVAELDYGSVKILSSVVASSAVLQAKYGGVVPEVAAREQIRSILPVIEEATSQYPINTVEAIAVSYGPGLMGSLLIGVETAKALALVHNKSLLKVNHMRGHVAANWIVQDGQKKMIPELPAVGLVVSGGHTDLIFIKTTSEWIWIGGTDDDAAGEAFDKAARLLGLPYPGGPSIQKAADLAKTKQSEKLPRPMIHEQNLRMSFSGLKSALSRMVLGKTLDEDQKNDTAYEFSQAVVELLLNKTFRAVDKFSPKSLLVAGGVAANTTLREELQKEAEVRNLPFFVPELKYCGDNAAMIAASALLDPIEVSPEDLYPEPGLETV